MKKYIFLFFLYHFTGLIGVYSQSYTEDDIIEFSSPSSNADLLTDSDVYSYAFSSILAFEIPISDLKTLTVRFFPGNAKDAELYLSTTPIDPNNLSSLASYSYQASTNSDLTFELNDIETKYILIKSLDGGAFFSEVEFLSIPQPSPPYIRIDETLVHSPNNGVNSVISSIEISDPNGDEISNITTESDYYSLNASNTALIISQTPPVGKNEIKITATANGDT